MSTSDKVKAILAMQGKRQIELAEHFGIAPQSMSNKMARDSWSTKDLLKVAKFCGCKLAFVLPDGQLLTLDNEQEANENDVS